MCVRWDCVRAATNTQPAPFLTRRQARNNPCSLPVCLSGPSAVNSLNDLWTGWRLVPSVLDPITRETNKVAVWRCRRADRSIIFIYTLSLSLSI